MEDTNFWSNKAYVLTIAVTVALFALFWICLIVTTFVSITQSGNSW